MNLALNDGPLSDDEWAHLEAILGTPELRDTAMDPAMMEGLFAALVVGPRTVMPSEWIPWIWDRYEGDAQPAFVDDDEANALLQLIFRHYNSVVIAFMDDPAAFQPLYEQSPQWSASAWCEGFALAVDLGIEDWVPLLVGHPDWMAPFNRLGTEEGRALTAQDGDAEAWMAQLRPMLQKIHAFWREQRLAVPAGLVEDEHLFGHRATWRDKLSYERTMPQRRPGPKVGRNDPCPCGSGKKFKKCCATVDPTLH